MFKLFLRSNEIFMPLLIFQKICDKEANNGDCMKDPFPISDTAIITNKNMSTLTLIIEQVSYSMVPTSRSISNTNSPSNHNSLQGSKHNKNTESCLSSEHESTRTNANASVSFKSTTGFWQKAPYVSIEIDHPDSQKFQTTAADTNRREMDEHGEETQSYAWANAPQFDM